MNYGGPRIEVLDTEACKRLLTTATVGRIGICIGALPAIRTVRYRLADRQVVFRARHGSRLYDGAADKIVAFHTDFFDESAGEGWTVQAQGYCRVLPPGPGVDQIDRSLEDLWPAATPADALLSLGLDQLSGERVRW